MSKFRETSMGGLQVLQDGVWTEIPAEAAAFLRTAVAAAHLANIYLVPTAPVSRDTGEAKAALAEVLVERHGVLL